MSRAIVIGGSPGGLVAAATLARAGVSVVLVEAETALGGSCANRVAVENVMVPSAPPVLTALDPRAVKDLKLTRYGLKFAARDLPLTGLSAEGRLALPRDVHEARRGLLRFSGRDAARYADFRRTLFDFARAMRLLWWEEGAPHGEKRESELHRMKVTSAAALLDAAFESEALKAAFAFDALAGGMSPADAGSALLFAWQAAQEMCGLQGAAAVPQGGLATLAGALGQAAEAAGVEIRTGEAVESLLFDGERIAGAVLASGEEIEASAVLSSLSRQKTLLDFLPPGAAGFAAARRLGEVQETGEARLLLLLKTVPDLLRTPGRFVIAEKLENAVAAHLEARQGRLPEEPVLEVVATDLGTSLLVTVSVRPVPVAGWPELASPLAGRVLHRLEQVMPETGAAAGIAFVPPQPCEPLAVPHLLASWRERIATQVAGLYLCGETAEPVPAVSGRAGRLAAAMAVAELKGAAS